MKFGELQNGLDHLVIGHAVSCFAQSKDFLFFSDRSFELFGNSQRKRQLVATVQGSTIVRAKDARADRNVLAMKCSGLVGTTTIRQRRGEDVFETNGSNGAVSQLVNLQVALDRLPPVLNVRKYTEAESVSSKAISLPFQINNDSIREVLVVQPSQIQVIDQYGDAIQLQLIKGGLPTTAIVLTPGETRTLTIRLDIDKPFGTTERFRWTSIRIQSNGGNREVTWNLNHLIDRLPPRLEFSGYAYDSWIGSSLQYVITLKNNSIRDELIVDLSETELPQHVTVVSPSGPLKIAPGKTATVAISIFTSLPESELEKLVRFTIYFDSNDPRGKRGITIHAKSLE